MINLPVILSEAFKHNGLGYADKLSFFLAERQAGGAKARRGNCLVLS
jgi:hypothetical protein